MPSQHSDVICGTRIWLEKAVIGLNLCPFAKAVHVKQQIRYRVSDAKDSEHLGADLREEIKLLLDADPNQIETTLLIHPNVLTHFLDFNDFLCVADGLLKRLNLEGALQIASFHPDYQFADTQPDDIENYTNRSPYPTLHILREASVSRAVDSYPNPDDIFQKNKKTMRKLGINGWKKLLLKES